MTPLPSLAGKTAIVTGASQGIGRGIVRALAGAGSPESIGRAVVHLLADPALLGRTGQTLTVGCLARTCHFTDVDGRQPPPFRMPPQTAMD